MLACHTWIKALELKDQVNSSQITTPWNLSWTVAYRQHPPRRVYRSSMLSEGTILQHSSNSSNYCICSNRQRILSFCSSSWMARKVCMGRGCNLEWRAGCLVLSNNSSNSNYGTNKDSKWHRGPLTFTVRRAPIRGQDKTNNSSQWCILGNSSSNSTAGTTTTKTSEWICLLLQIAKRVKIDAI